MQKHIFAKRFVKIEALLAACMLFAPVKANAADILSVGSFTSAFLQLSDGMSGGYTMSAASVVSGAVHLTGGAYSVNVGVLDALGAMPETLKDAHVWPNPCNAGRGCEALMFSKLTYHAEIKIYTVSGELVWQAVKQDEYTTKSWDLRNMQGHKAASGLYVYYIKTGNSSKKGKFILIR